MKISALSFNTLSPQGILNHESAFVLPTSAHTCDLNTMTPSPNKLVYGASFSKKGLTDMDIQMLSKEIKKNEYKGTALFLSQNHITDKGAMTLFKSLHHNSQIQHLILSKNQLTEFAMAGLSDLLKVNHVIGWLILSKNKLKDRGIFELVPGLKKNKGLKHLVLQDIELTDEGLKALLDALIDHPTLESLFLQENPIQKGSLIEFFLEKNKRIKRIHLENTGIKFLRKTGLAQIRY